LPSGRAALLPSAPGHPKTYLDWEQGSV
jgi:hypothetical protein